MEGESDHPMVTEPPSHLQREGPNSGHGSPHPIFVSGEEHALSAREANTRHLSLSSGTFTPTPSLSSKTVMFETPDGARCLSATPGNGHTAERVP